MHESRVGCSDFLNRSLKLYPFCLSAWLIYKEETLPQTSFSQQLNSYLRKGKMENLLRMPPWFCWEVPGFFLNIVLFTLMAISVSKPRQTGLVFLVQPSFHILITWFFISRARRWSYATLWNSFTSPLSTSASLDIYDGLILWRNGWNRRTANPSRSS